MSIFTTVNQRHSDGLPAQTPEEIAADKRAGAPEFGPLEWVWVQFVRPWYNYDALVRFVCTCTNAPPAPLDVPKDLCPCCCAVHVAYPCPCPLCYAIRQLA
jgi:hypothetical protein